MQIIKVGLKFIVVVVLFFPGMVSAAAWPGDAGVEIGVNLGAGYEPSGAVWHEERETLFIVGDDGDITELDEDGTIINTINPAGDDLEGIAIADPTSDYIYVGVENPDGIIEVDISGDPWVLSGKTWDLTPWMIGAANQGLEALTFVSTDVNDYFYAGLQENGKVYVFDVNLNVSDDVSYIENFALEIGLTNISGLDYQSDTETLYGLFDGANKIIEAQSDGTFIQEYSIPGNDQEGIALVPACPSATTDIYLAEDLGPELWKYGEYPVDTDNCPVPDPDPDPDPNPDPDDDEDEDEEDDETDEDVYSALIKGKLLKVFLNGEKIAQKKIYKKKQIKARVRIRDFYSNGRYEIITVGLRGKKARIKTYRLTSANNIKFKKKKKIVFKKDKKRLLLKTRLAKKRFHTTFGKKKYIWKIKEKGKFEFVKKKRI
ncbi:MAG: SdiA-regulated domain-containing protein [Patescibacteria group bacterium]